MGKIRFFKPYWILTLAVFLLLLLPAYTGHCQAQLKVVASIFPLYEFAREVGGNRSEVALLLPPGAEAHSWEPKPGDIAKISKADVFIYLGASMEPWVEKVLTASRGKEVRVVEAGRGLHLLKAEHPEKEHGKPGHSHGYSHGENLDPHIWLDFHLDRMIVEAIAHAFAEKDPAHKETYQKNSERHQARLKDLDQKYRASLSNCRHRKLILGGHAAFAYLAKKYGLEQISLSGVSPNAEPTPKRMAEVIEVTRKAGSRYIFSEEMVNKKLAQALAREAGVSVLILNPGANLTREEGKDKLTFIDLMENNLANLRKGLECGD